MEKTAADFDVYLQNHPDSIFLFLRVEGPFISREKKGIQPDEYILPLTDENIDRFLVIRAIRMFTFAPELEGAESLVKKAMAAGKIPSIEHSGATTVPDQVRLLVEEGFRLEDIIRVACVNGPGFFGRAPEVLENRAVATCAGDWCLAVASNKLYKR